MLSNIFLDLSINRLEEMTIYDLIENYFFIREYIKNNIDSKLIEMFGATQIESSAFDSFDKENGYEDLEEEFNIYDSYLDTINMIIQYSIEKCRNSLNETLNMNIVELLEYMEFSISQEETEQED